MAKSSDREAMEEVCAELARRRAHAAGMGGEERIARHHASGRLTARERIDLLVDEDTFHEIGLLAEPEIRPEHGYGGADGIITGWALVQGRRVAVVAVDATVLGGTTAWVNSVKLNRIAEQAGRSGMPIITLSDADGGRMPDVMGWRFPGLPLRFGSVFATPVGYPTVLRLAAALGPCFGDAGLEVSSAHIGVMTKDASIALSGTEVVGESTGERLTNLELGGPDVAAAIAGTVEIVVDTEQEAIATLRRAITYFPDHAGAPAPVVAPVPPEADADTLLDVVPVERRRGYDVRKVLKAVVDADSLLEYGAPKGRSLLCALARIEGEPVGIAASQPQQRGGVLDQAALEKLLTFIELCDTMNLPFVSLHDVPGLMIGAEAEKRGLLKMLEKLTVALDRARVPTIALILRKSYGGGYFVMGSRQTRPDLLLAWPTAELGFMAPEAGIATVHRRELQQTEAEHGREARDELMAKYVEEWSLEAQPWEAAAHFYLDDIIDPRDTRRVLATSIRFCWNSERVSPAGT